MQTNEIEAKLRQLAKLLPRYNRLRQAIESASRDSPSIANANERTLLSSKVQSLYIPAHDGELMTIRGAHGTYVRPMLDKQSDALLAITMVVEDTELRRMYAWVRGYVQWCHSGETRPFTTASVPHPKNLIPALQSQINDLVLLCAQGHAAACWDQS